MMKCDHIHIKRNLCKPKIFGRNCFAWIKTG